MTTAPELPSILFKEGKAMKEYKRTELTITEFDAEDVITTSGMPEPQNNSTVTMNSPNYQSGSGGSQFGWNWTLWQ